MADLQAGVDVLSEDAGAGGLLAAPPRQAAAEDELEPLGTAQVEVQTHHLLEELAAVERALPRGDDYPEDGREAQVQGAGERSG